MRDCCSYGSSSDCWYIDWPVRLRGVCGEDGQANKSKGGGGSDSEEHKERAAAAVRQKLTL